MELPKYALKIKDKREKKLLSQEELAKLIGVSTGRVVSLYERGQRKPSMNRCKVIATILGGKPVDYRKI